MRASFKNRFGAEALFKEDDKEVQDKSKALYEDSIDAILARAEVLLRLWASVQTVQPWTGDHVALITGHPGKQHRCCSAHRYPVGFPLKCQATLRPQVVDERAGKNEGADELLSAFNVATFKSAEDDKAFWNRLIPVDAQGRDSAKKDVRN